MNSTEEAIRNIKSNWLPEKELELQRLSSLNRSSLALPILHALEFERQFSSTHHVFIHCQSFEEGLATMFFKEINFHLTKQKLPYRQQFGYIDEDSEVVEDDIRKSGERLMEIGQKLRRDGSKLKNIMQNFSQDKLMEMHNEMCNTFVHAGIKEYEKAFRFLSVSRLSNPASTQSFLFNEKCVDLRDFTSKKFQLGYRDSVDKIFSLFSAILASRQENTGMLNVILIPKNLKNAFYESTSSETNIYMNQMVNNQEILTIRLVNDEREFMKGIKQKFRSFNFSDIPEFTNKKLRWL